MLFAGAFVGLVDFLFSAVKRATNIAEDVIFIVSARDVRYQPMPEVS